MDNLEDALSENTVQEVIDQEGMQTIVEYVEFLQEALELAVMWLHDVTEETTEDIRQIISERVQCHSMEDIINKLEAIQLLQGSIEE